MMKWRDVMRAAWGGGKMKLTLHTVYDEEQDFLQQGRTLPLTERKGKRPFQKGVLLRGGRKKGKTSTQKTTSGIIDGGNRVPSIARRRGKKFIKTPTLGGRDSGHGPPQGGGNYS